MLDLKTAFWVYAAKHLYSTSLSSEAIHKIVSGFCIVELRAVQNYLNELSRVGIARKQTLNNGKKIYYSITTK